MKCRMDTKSKILLIVFVLILAGAVSATFVKYVIFQDYVVEISIDCDPMEESCFRYECDPEWEECTGDPQEDVSFYKLLTRKAYNMPECDPESPDCLWDQCPPNEKYCEIADCVPEELTEDDAEWGITCAGREEYLEEFPKSMMMEEDEDMMVEESMSMDEDVMEGGDGEGFDGGAMEGGTMEDESAGDGAEISPETSDERMGNEESTGAVDTSPETETPEEKTLP